MKKTCVKVLSMLAVFMLLASCFALPAFAAVNPDTYYLKIDGIEGESQDRKHDKWIEVISFKHGSTVSVVSGKPGYTGDASFDPVVFTHTVDKSSPMLREACMKEKSINKVVFEATAAISGKSETVYKVTLEGVKVIKAEEKTEVLADGTETMIEEVWLLSNKQTWTSSAVGLDNALGGNTEACFDQTKKCTMLGGSTNLTVAIISVAAFVIIAVAAILVITAKNRKKAAAQEE